MKTCDHKHIHTNTMKSTPIGAMSYQFIDIKANILTGIAGIISSFSMCKSGPDLGLLNTKLHLDHSFLIP